MRLACRGLCLASHLRSLRPPPSLGRRAELGSGREHPAPPRRRVRLRLPGRLFSPEVLKLRPQQGSDRQLTEEIHAPPAGDSLARFVSLCVGDPRRPTGASPRAPRCGRKRWLSLGPPPTPARLTAPSGPALMARLLTVTLGCISFLYLQLPGALSLGLARSRPPARPR